ncbi:MAG: glycosyltransferase, partial [Anaerolineales bacterium]|nr:glycosyltransferase [Anaerolineales bacterium]
MRLVLVVSAFPKLSETFIVSKFLGLLDAGWDVHIVCRRSNASEWHNFPELANRPDIRHRIHLTWPTKPRWRASLLMPVALGRVLLANPGYGRRGWRRWGIGMLRHTYLDAALAELKPDLVHFEFGSLAVERMHLPQMLNCPVTVSFRGYDLNYIGLEKADYYAPLWRKAAGLHLLGHDLWQRAQRRGCPADKPHALIPPAIDTTFFQPEEPRTIESAVGTPDRPLRILSVGRLEWKKGYEYALQAVQLLQQQGIHCEYHIIGGGDKSAAIAFARHQLRLDDTAQFLGATPRAEVKKQMAWADLFLHAAVSEGFCNAVIEAQAMQLPIVTSDADGLAENVAHNTTGFVVSRRDPHGLALGMARLAREPALRRQFGEAGRRRVLDKFSLDSQIQAFSAFYSERIGHSHNLVQLPGRP